MARRSARTKSAAHAAEKARAAQKKTPSKRKKTSTRSSSTSKKTVQRKSPVSTRKKAPTKSSRSKSASTPQLPSLNTGERYFILSVPFALRSVATAFKAKYYKGYGHVFIGKSLPPMLQHFASPDFSYERWIEDDLNNSIQAPSVDSYKFVPRPHQQEAMKKIFASAKHGFRGFIEADDVGLGKTLSCAYGAYGVAKLRQKKNVLIVCPKSVISHWANALRSLPQTDGIRYCIINYESSKKLLELPPNVEEAKRKRTKNSQIASHGVSKIDWDVIVADESHKLKNVYSSQRSKIFTKIARYDSPVKDAPFIIYASATIGQNPAELAYMSPLLAQLSGNAELNSIKDWTKLAKVMGVHGEYNKDLNKYVWTEDPIEQKHDTQLMRSLLFSPKSPSIRRLPSQISGWPVVNYVVLPYELDEEGYELYDSLWTEFVDQMELDKKSKNPKGLAIQLRFRQKTSILKIDNTVDLAIDYLENGRKVIISVDFEDSAELLRERLEAHNYRVEEFTGRNVDTREQSRINFQKGKADVMLFNVREGVSFHANEQLNDGTVGDKTPRETIIHDLPYTAIETHQISGRAHRDGQFSNIIIPSIKGTIDEKMTHLIVDRLKSMKETVGDDVDFIAKMKSAMLGKN